MPAVSANLRLITASVEIDGDTYNAHIQDYNFTPAATTSEVTDISGVVHKFAGESGWTCNLNVFQDFSTTGLARKMLDDEGETVTLKITDGPTTWTADVTFVAPTIGGPTKSVGVSSLALPSSRPVPTASA